MTFMTWTDNMSVGVTEFDSEHRQLITIINQLHEGLSASSAKPTLKKTLAAMERYTEEHFAHEEALFEKTQYPLAAEHKALHCELTQLIRQYGADVESKDCTLLALQLLCFLKEWLAHHIMQDDKKYGAFLNSKGIH